MRFANKVFRVVKAPFYGAYVGASHGVMIAWGCSRQAREGKSRGLSAAAFVAGVLSAILFWIGGLAAGFVLLGYIFVDWELHGILKKIEAES